MLSHTDGLIVHGPGVEGKLRSPRRRMFHGAEP
jgi:hypothetical protein